MSEFADSDVRVFVRGDGCYVIDADGRRAIDGISGLFCSNLGHGYGDGDRPRPRTSSSPTLVFTPSWYVTHPAAAALAERLGRRGRRRSACTGVFLTSGGGEANEATVQAGPPVARRERPAAAPQGDLAPARLPRHLARGAVADRPARTAGTPFEPLPIQTAFVSNTNAYRHPLGARRGRLHRRAAGRDRGRRSSGRARTRSRCSSPSRCRTPAARSPRRAATGRACARSATGTASCSSPTRSSPASAGSASGSRRCATSAQPGHGRLRQGRHRRPRPARRRADERPGRRAVRRPGRCTCTASPTAATR